MTVFNKKQKAINQTPQLDQHEFLLVSLQSIQDRNLIRFIGEEMQELNIVKVVWAVQVLPQNPDDNQLDLAVIYSYFDSRSGEHVSTHIGSNVLNDPQFSDVFINSSVLIQEIIDSRDYSDLILISIPR